MNRKSILLYGDSLFWGVDATVMGRHSYENRVDNVLRSKLDKSYEVVCEGLRGRCMFGENGWFPERDGLSQFGPIFASHLPIDIVVIMLGTNDLNTKTNHTPSEIASALKEYKIKMKFWVEFMKYQMPKVLVVAPPYIKEGQLIDVFKPIFSGSGQYIDGLADELQSVTKELDWYFLDTRESITSEGMDGIHLSGNDSKKLGNVIYESLRSNLLA